MCVTASTITRLLFFYRGLGSDVLRFLLYYSVAIFLSEVYAAIVSGFSSLNPISWVCAISLIKTYWGGCPYLPEGYRSLPQTTIPLHLSPSGEPQMPISAQILQLFILVLCPRPKLCTGVSSWTVKSSKKRKNRIERGKMVKVKDTLFFSFLSTFYINIISSF